MIAAVAAALVVGTAVGVVVGRFWAEASRARWDMRRVWSTRRDHRRGGRGPRRRSPRQAQRRR